MNFNAEEVVEIVMNNWEIGGEVVCEYSDEEFDDHDDEMLVSRRQPLLLNEERVWCTDVDLLILETLERKVSVK